MKKKVKQLEIIILLLLIVILILVGYILNIKAKKGELSLEDKTDTIEEKQSIKIDKNKKYVEDANYRYESDDEIKNYTSKDVSYWTNNLIKGEKTIAVPYINFNTSDAIEANIDIYHLYMEKMKVLESIMKENQDKSAEEKKSGLFLNYVTYYTKNYVSIVIATGRYSSKEHTTTYYGYVFDLKTGKQLNIADIAGIDGYSLDELETHTKESIEHYANKKDKEIKRSGVYTDKLDLTYDKLHTSISNNGKVDANTDGVVYYIDDFQSIVALVNIYTTDKYGVHTSLLDIN